jgi:hypothetical protein
MARRSACSVISAPAQGCHARHPRYPRPACAAFVSPWRSLRPGGPRAGVRWRGLFARPWQRVFGPGAPVVPEPAAAQARVRRGSEPDDGVGAVLGCEQDRPGDPPEARECGGDPRGVHPAGVHGVEGDAGPSEPPCRFPAQRDLGPLGPRVRGDAPVARGGQLQGGEVEAMPRLARSARPRSRARKWIAAPRRASATAAAWPIPEVAPVMTTTFPSAAGGSSAVNSGSSRDRTARPIREKPGTMQASRVASTAGLKLVTVCPRWLGRPA